MIEIKNLLLIFIFGIIGGFLGAYGGATQTSKIWRRLGIPIILIIYALFTLHNWWVLTILSMIGAFSMGYGIPDPPHYPNPDPGSMLGAFFYKLFKQNSTLANIFTRGIIGILVCVSLISIPILRGNWIIYGLSSLAIIITYAGINWRGLGTFDFRKKKLLYSEFIAYFIVTGLATQLLIKY